MRPWHWPGKWWHHARTLLLEEQAGRAQASDQAHASNAERAESYKQEVREAAWAWVTRLLAVKLALSDTSDGTLSELECAALHQHFGLGDPADTTRATLKKWTQQAIEDTTSLSVYASQLQHFYPNNRRKFSALMEQLVAVAASDGTLHLAELSWLNQWSACLGLPPHVLSTALSPYIVPASESPYAVLGVGKTVTREEAAMAYRQAAGQYHPDRMQAIPDGRAIRALAEQRQHVLQEAYTTLRTRRKW